MEFTCVAPPFPWNFQLWETRTQTLVTTVSWPFEKFPTCYSLGSSQVLSLTMIEILAHLSLLPRGKIIFVQNESANSPPPVLEKTHQLCCQSNYFKKYYRLTDAAFYKSGCMQIDTIMLNCKKKPCYLTYKSDKKGRANMRTFQSALFHGVLHAYNGEKIQHFLWSW